MYRLRCYWLKHTPSKSMRFSYETHFKHLLDVFGRVVLPLGLGCEKFAGSEKKVTQHWSTEVDILHKVIFCYTPFEQIIIILEHNPIWAEQVPADEKLS